MPPAYNAEHRIGPIKDIFAMKGTGQIFVFYKRLNTKDFKLTRSSEVIQGQIRL